MEGVQSIGAPAQSGFQLYQLNAKFELNATIINGSLQGNGSNNADSVDTSLSQLYQGLTTTAKSIVDKINDLLKSKVPNGVQSLDPQEVTPEATADRIVKSISGLFDAFAKSNSDLSSQDLLTKFMDAVRSGVKTGYDDAFKTLKDLGAFDFNGVQDGVEKTRSLLDTKLDALEDDLKQKLGITPAQDASADATKTAILAQAGGLIANNQLSVVA